MFGPGGLEGRMRAALLIALVAIVIVAPLLGAFVFGPLIVAMDIQPYPLASALGLMLAEALAIGALAWLVFRKK
jgi:hypothetical protein